ncbi:hypothetical protein ACFX13_026712 [Malus domestica]
MARNTNMAFFAAVAAAALLMSSAAAATTYQVGDGLSWVVPPGGAAAYATWAANKTFVVGDTLVFTFTSGSHDVAEVTKPAFDACNVTSPITLHTASPTNITLNSSGEHYYICTFAGHCSAGQKLSINVNGASSPAPAPAPSTTPPPPPPSPPASVPAPAPSTSTPTPAASPAPTPSSTRAPVTWTVGNNSGWTVLPPGSYQTWAANKTFLVGDTLVFNYLNGTHDVAVVTKANYDSCNTSNTLAPFTIPPTRITLNTTGENFFICTFTGHCVGGQKLAINVTSGSTTATPPSSTATPPSSSATPPGSSATPPSGTPTTPTTPSSPTPEGAAPPPPPNAAASLGAAGLSASFLSIALALLF